MWIWSCIIATNCFLCLSCRRELIHITKSSMQDMLIREIQPSNVFYKPETNLTGMHVLFCLGLVFWSMNSTLEHRGKFERLILEPWKPGQGCLDIWLIFLPCFRLLLLQIVFFFYETYYFIKCWVGAVFGDTKRKKKLSFWGYCVMVVFSFGLFFWLEVSNSKPGLSICSYDDALDALWSQSHPFFY